MTQRIISFSGRKHSGKTLLAEQCQKHGYILINFADSLKNVTCAILDISLDNLNRIKDHKQPFTLTNTQIINLASLIELSYDNILNVFPKGYYLKSIREFLQRVGTDLIRKFNPNWHINKIRYIITKNPDKNYCIGDTRFPQEKELIEELNGECWFIFRPEYTADISNHISETSLNWSYFDKNYIIVNNETRENLIATWNHYLHFNENIFKKYQSDSTYLFSDKLESSPLFFSMDNCNPQEITKDLDGSYLYRLENLKQWTTFQKS
jgi:hypothetical protein